MPVPELVALGRRNGVKGLSERMTAVTLVRRVTAAAA